MGTSLVEYLKQIYGQTPVEICDVHEQDREALLLEKKMVWLEAWKTVASSELCNQYQVAKKWADKCLNDYCEKFLD